MHTKNEFGKGVAVCLLLALAGTVTAAPVYWTDWTSATPGDPDTVIGTITGAGPGSVEVTYTGDYAFAIVSGGVNYWTPASAFHDHDLVDNEPALKDIIGLRGGGERVHTLTFSQPVVNPVMAIVSLGKRHFPATYVFDASFDIVCQGPSAYGTLTESLDKCLEGEDGDGTIQFPGTFSAIHWTIPTAEYWQGFTVGICGIGDEDHEEPHPEPIPAPGTLLLGSIGTGLIGYLRRRAVL